MNLYELRQGDRVRTREDIVAEVLEETQDGRWIKVRYIRADESPEVVGTEDLCSEEDILEKLFGHWASGH